MALEALWMLELASQRGFRERARHRVSEPANPREVDGAGFFDTLGRNAGLSERSEPAPETESVPGFFGVQGNWACQGFRRAGPPAHPAITAEPRYRWGLKTH